MEENKRELNPEEMEDINGGARVHFEPVHLPVHFFKCEECSFVAPSREGLSEHMWLSHRRRSEPTETWGLDISDMP